MSDDDPDASLLARVGRGDPAAVRRLVTAKAPRVLGLAARLLGDRSEAEDVCQDAFMRVWRGARGWKPGVARFDTWLYTVVLNLCRDRLRRRRPTSEEALAAVVDPAPDPEQAMVDLEQEHAVRNAVAALPERQREAILLVHYQDCSGSQAAAVMGISLDALESLLARGRRSLQGRLNPPKDRDADA